MKKIDDKGIISLMREEYVSHLKGLINEVDVYDSRGKLIIGPDLKVLHKKSGYEYTVDSVRGKKGNVQITLRTPETPRPTTQDITKIVPKDVRQEIEARKSVDDAMDMATDQVLDLESDKDKDKDDEDTEDKVDRGIKAYPKKEKRPDDGERIFVVDQAEFEKEYEEA
jgi:hypothetical protein